MRSEWGFFCVLGLAACRGVTPGLEDRVRNEWAAEPTQDICHYMYWPIPDPTASRDLKMLHYTIMQAELDRRGVDCAQVFPDVTMYRKRSMLDKLMDR